MKRKTTDFGKDNYLNGELDPLSETTMHEPVSHASEELTTLNCTGSDLHFNNLLQDSSNSPDNNEITEIKMAANHKMVPIDRSCSEIVDSVSADTEVTEDGIRITSNIYELNR